MATTTYIGGEPVTAIITLPRNGEDSEQLIGPAVIGYYGPHGGGEIWIEQEGKRVQIPAAHFAAVMRELKRANKIAAEVAKD